MTILALIGQLTFSLTFAECGALQSAPAVRLIGYDHMANKRAVPKDKMVKPRKLTRSRCCIGNDHHTEWAY